MSRRVLYKCDLCGDDKEEKSLFAVHFTRNRSGQFELVRWPSHLFEQSGKHLCFSCSEALLNQLYELKKKVSGS